MSRIFVSCTFAILAVLGAVPSHAASQDICLWSERGGPGAPFPEKVCIPSQSDCVWCAITR